MASKRTKQRRGSRRPVVGRSLQHDLFDDEEVIMVARPGRLASLPRYVFTLGLYGIWRKRDTAVLTEQRILLGKGVLRREDRSIPLKRVDDVAYARRGPYSYANVLVTDRERAVVRRIGPMAPRTTRRFAREILRRL